METFITHHDTLMFFTGIWTGLGLALIACVALTGGRRTEHPRGRPIIRRIK